MSLHDKIMNIPVALKDRRGIGKLLYNTGYKDARHAAAEMANEYDNFMDDVQQMMETIISMQSGSFSSDEGSSYELNSIADMAEEMLVKIKEIKQ